ncbi:acetyl/propionyl/methylcrotonyl-CoA carboxylase subunit alpha [Solimonas marina]|uniref:Biotin carboxylase n=1 Tax=Solimonas marina TaxID=2714601 RepID=A0A969WBL9_9GAMM|nr:acetyl-CoA carboxylase biotin carboxylase subunit [Solimonas marina]NKF23549.1 acetyl-CoA carboxylase biotin carboxylase subunit [Solimonas marina]
MSATVRPFSKLLVANRGEIAVRVIRGAQALGYRTVAVYSDADRDALHVRLADEAVHIGPAPAAESYLSIERLIAAARASGAEAIHPGYGFLSERAEFAQAVQDAGLVFIGPDAESIAAMGNKSASKRLMIDAGVPCVPGYQGDDQRDETLIAEARRIGLPVMVKAAAGGGGRGMRIVDDESGLAAAIASARSEAANAFGSGELLIEKAVLDARHVEIQVFGDRHGQVVHFGERDCSVQRRNQKVVEEAPSPAVDDALRERMGSAAVTAARAVHYVGAGTVEFMLAADGSFYFLEMNTRLQVEHPVTEMVYGVDLVEWQLRVAAGAPLPLTQDAILARRRGAAIEVRLCAEDADADYHPQTGRVLSWRPPHGVGVRVDAGLFTGLEIGPYYDSMQAKLIAWGETRDAARLRLLQALDDTTLLGVTSNRDFLRRIVAHPAFAAGEVTTGFLARHLPPDAATAPDATLVALAAVALYRRDQRQLADAHGLDHELLGWHSSHATPTALNLRWRDHDLVATIALQPGGRYVVQVGDDVRTITVVDGDDAHFVYVRDGLRRRAQLAFDGDAVWIDAEQTTACFDDRSLAPVQGAAPGSDGRLLAHSDGRIVAVHVQPGAHVERAQVLLVLEAMKMEFQLSLPVAGRVETVGVQVGEQVRARQLLLQLTPDANTP